MSSFPPIEELCGYCNDGLVDNHAWDDWKPGDRQLDEPEEIACRECEGIGTILTPLGEAIMRAIYPRIMADVKRRVRRSDG